MKIKLYISALLITAMLFTSCTDDDLNGLDPSNKPTATTSVRSLSIIEGQSDVIPFTISNPITKASQFKIEVLNGAAEQNIDFTAGASDTDADTGIPGVGFEITVPAYVDSFDIPVSALIDTMCEINENVQLKITAAGVRTILTPTSGGYIIDVTVEDAPTWILETSDTYGDGWNGGYVEVNIDGAISTYYEDDDIPTTFLIPIPVGSSYSFTYVSGGGTGGGPGWESENYFKLTSPDGATVIEEGSMDYSSIPTPGLLTSGTSASSCN